MLPDEKLPNAKIVDWVGEIDGYLVEVRSIGGLSGSPAFVRAPIGLNFSVHNRGGNYRTATGHVQGDYFFLGLTHGHWEVDHGQYNDTEIVAVPRSASSLNLGIAVVIPAKKILEVLHNPQLVYLRAESERLCRESMATSTPDGANRS
jgi:hypothetical protein